MVKERYAADGGFPAVERGVQRISKFTGIRIARRAAGNGSGRGVKILAVGSEEMLPGGFATGGAGRGQSKVFHMKRNKVVFKFLPGGGFSGKAFGGAALERKRKPFQSNSPAGRLRLDVEFLDQGGAAIQQQGKT